MSFDVITTRAFNDYRETMESGTLFKIRDELREMPLSRLAGTSEAKRLKRINQVLRDRGHKKLNN